MSPVYLRMCIDLCCGPTADGHRAEEGLVCLCCGHWVSTCSAHRVVCIIISTLHPTSGPMQYVLQVRKRPVWVQYLTHGGWTALGERRVSISTATALVLDYVDSSS